MRPPSSCSSPAMSRSTVDFPDPDGPSSAVMPPPGAVNDTSATAGVPPAVNRFVTFSTVTCMAPSVRAVGAARLSPALGSALAFHLDQLERLVLAEVDEVLGRR